MLGIPAIYRSRISASALFRMEPIFEPIFDDVRFGYRRGRSPKDALRKIWKEIQKRSERIVTRISETFSGLRIRKSFICLGARS
jgi:retron-type reverse transcriptase